MGFLSDLFGGGGSNSTQTTASTDSRIGASDSAYVQTNAASSKTQNGGLQLGTSRDVQLAFQSVDKDIVTAALHTVADVVHNQSNLSLQNSAAGAASMDAANQRIADLSLTKVTDGANLNQKTTLIALIVIGGLGAIFFFLTRKH